MGGFGCAAEKGTTRKAIGQASMGTLETGKKRSSQGAVKQSIPDSLTCSRDARTRT